MPSTESYTFYCPTCGTPVEMMPGWSVICAECGRRVSPQRIPDTAAVAAVAAIASVSVSDPIAPSGPPPLPRGVRGTPGIVVAMLLYFFFPVGLYLLWTHSVWTERQKWKYTLVWLAAFGGLFVVSLLFCAAMVLGRGAL
jgi:hypothetical protein